MHLFVEAEIVQFLEVEKFRKRHIERVCYLVQPHYARAFGCARHHIGNRRLLYVAELGELINRIALFLAKLVYSLLSIRNIPFSDYYPFTGK